MNKNKKILIVFALVIVFVVSYIVFSDREPISYITHTIEESETIARDWMENESLTYKYDGFDLELYESWEHILNVYVFLYNFNSRSAGYGDRSNEMTAQVITPHQTAVWVDRGVVFRAITDGDFCEFTGTFIGEESEPETINALIYFAQIDNGQEILVSTTREIEWTHETPRETLVELIRGPSQEEINAGYFSSINSNTQINNLTINNYVAYTDFSEELQSGVAGSATVMMIRNQIEETLKQFDNIDEVVISINGETEDVLQP